MSDIEFFSEVDLSPTGKLSSEYPAWYNQQIVEDLENQVRVEEHYLQSGSIPKDAEPEARENLKKKKARLDQILKSKPKLSDADKDKLAKVREELGERISEAMFTRGETQRGLADPHEEARRMTHRSLSLSPTQAGIAKQCGIPIGSDRKVSRTQMEKVWKITSKALGERANTEALRRD